MQLRKQAVLGLWNGVLPEWQASYEAWHAQEHLPERLSAPGLLGGLRYRRVDGAPAYFTLYLLDSHDALQSDAYRAMVDAPTPWSTAMRPRLTDFRRQAAWLECDAELAQVPWLRIQEGAGGVAAPDVLGTLRAADVASAHPLAQAVAAGSVWTLSRGTGAPGEWQLATVHHRAAGDAASAVRPAPRMDLYANFERAA